MFASNQHLKFWNCVPYVLVVALFSFSDVNASTWFVRPAGGNYGPANGQSYATAWAGLSNIAWGANGVKAGDTLYVCGKHFETLNIMASGTFQSRINIDGACQNDPGILVGWAVTNPNGWTSPNGDGIYVYNTLNDPGVYGTRGAEFRGRAFFVNGTIQLPATQDTPDGLGSTLTDGVWYKGVYVWGNNDFAYKIFFRPPAGHSPSEYTLQYSAIDHAINAVDQEYFYVNHLTMYGHNSYIGDALPNAVVAIQGLNKTINRPVVQNCIISNAYGTGVEVWNADTAYVQDNEIYNTMNGVYFKEGTNRSYILRNKIHHIGQADRYYGADHYGIAIGSTKSNTHNGVEYNSVSFVGDLRTGIAYDGAVGAWSESADQYNSFIGNSIHDNVGGGLDLGYHSGGDVVAYNLIYNNGDPLNNGANGGWVMNGGLYLGASAGSAASVYVFNNTIVSNKVHDSVNRAQIFGNSTEATRVQMFNNVVVTTTGARAFVMPYGLNVVSDYNIFFAPVSSDPLIMVNGWNASNKYTRAQFSSYQTATQQDFHSITSDPSLSATYTPTSLSPAIDTGMNLGSSWNKGLGGSSVWSSQVVLIDQDAFGTAWERGAFIYQP